MAKERQFYPKWNVEVHGGRVVFEDREKFDEHLVPYDGKQMHLIIKRRHSDRSRQEEKYYWAVVVEMIAKEMETGPTVVHDMLKKFFLKTEESDGRGRRFERILSTTELTDKAYREYWKKCQQWAALPTASDGLGPESGLELYIPNPNEVDYSNY